MYLYQDPLRVAIRQSDIIAILLEELVVSWGSLTTSQPIVQC